MPAKGSERRDIERILFRYGLSHYDVMRIAEIARGIHPKELLWIAYSEDEKLNDAMTGVFNSIFHQKTDMIGDSIDTPEGHNMLSGMAYMAGSMVFINSGLVR